MALIVAFVVFLYFSASCNAGEDNSEVQCKVQTIGKAISSEFRAKASEEGVRIVYINLRAGNDTYHPLEQQDEFLPSQWVWAKSIKEPMLSFPFDYDILSLGLLNFQVRRVTVEIEDQPSGCLAGINSSQQNIAVGSALLLHVTHSINTTETLHKTEVVCVAMIIREQDGFSSVEYHCCRSSSESIECRLPVRIKTAIGSGWLNFNNLKTPLLFILLLYWPALFLAMPDWIINVKKECEKEDRRELAADNRHSRSSETYEQIPDQTESEIPVDDPSPVSLSHFLQGCIQSLPDAKLRSFNLRLAFVEFCLVPLPFFVQEGLYLALKQNVIEENTTKGAQAENLPVLSSFPLFVEMGSAVYLFISSWVVSRLFLLFFLKPTDLRLQQSGPLGMPRCAVCRISSKLSAFCGKSDSTFSPRFLADEIRYHLNALQKWLCLFMIIPTRRVQWQREGFVRWLPICLQYRICEDTKRGKQPLYILWGLFCLLAGIIIAVILIFLHLLFSLLLLFFCSPLVSIGVFCKVKEKELVETREWYRSKKNRIIFYAVCCFMYVCASFSLSTIITSTIFIASILEFTVAGLVLNARILAPYLTFSLVVAANLHLCYTKLQKRYKEMKGFISKYWRIESQITSADQDTIPAKLFWFVCDEVLPVETGICVTIRDMSLILTFLFVALSSILFFRNSFNISSEASTIAVFLSGAVPGLFFALVVRESQFNGWEKIKVKREVEAAVKEFYAIRRNESSTNRDMGERSRRNDGEVV